MTESLAATLFIIVLVTGCVLVAAALLDEFRR